MAIEEKIDLKALKKDLAISNEEMAERLCITTRTLSNYLAAEVVPGYMAKLIRYEFLNELKRDDFDLLKLSQDLLYYKSLEELLTTRVKDLEFQIEACRRVNK